MSEGRGRRDAQKSSGTAIRFDVPNTTEAGIMRTPEIFAIKENQAGAEYIADNAEAEGITIDYRGQESNIFGNDSFSFCLESTRSSDANSPHSSRLMTLPKQSILGSTKTADIPYQDVSKLSGIDFDESVYRTDDGKSDEEFLDPRFLEDLKKRTKDREVRSRKRAKDQGINYSRNSGDTMQSRESNLAEEAKEIIKQEVLNRRNELPILNGFLEKRSPAIHSKWQRRWVVVVDYTILYFKKEVHIKSRDKGAENDCLNELPLTTVEKITKDDKCKDGNKFEITARDPRNGEYRHYRWRCKDAVMCNYWVHGLVQHKDQALSELKIGARSRTSVLGMTNRGTDNQSMRK